MSLQDLLAAAGEELIGFRAARIGTDGVPDAVVRRMRWLWGRLAALSAVVFGICLLVASFLQPSTIRTAATYGLYLSLAAALISALGWAYCWAAHHRADHWARHGHRDPYE